MTHRKIVYYTIVTEPRDDIDNPDDFTEIINDFISEGYEPYGSPCIGPDNWIHQAMVKYEEKENLYEAEERNNE